MTSSVALGSLRAFRDSLYSCLRRRTDALFELTDAILTAGVVPSPVHLSLEPAHRRGWGSLYAALARGRIDAEALRELLVRHPLASGGEPSPVYAVDVSVWPRSDAESSPERGFYYHPSRHSAGQPTVAGWAYQFIAQIGFASESWVAPVDVARVRPAHNANETAVAQVRGVLGRLPERGGGAPSFVFDAGYDPVRLQQGIEGQGAQILVRLRAGRCFYADPPPPKRTGRPPRHGRKLDTKDPEKWPEPSAEHCCEDSGYGSVRVRAWAGLHPKTQEHPPAVLADRARSSGARWFWWRSLACHVPPASRGCCGFGGRGPAESLRISVSSGVPTSGASTWSILSAFSSRSSAGPLRGYATRSKPTCGRG